MGRIATGSTSTSTNSPKTPAAIQSSRLSPKRFFCSLSISASRQFCPHSGLQCAVGMVNSERLFDLFQSLCLLNAPALQEKDAVEWMKAHLLGLGLEVWEDDAGPKIGGNANNLVAKLAGTKPGAPAVFLSAHFDTVEPTAGLKIGERDGGFFSESDTILGADDNAGM